MAAEAKLTPKERTLQSTSLAEYEVLSQQRQLEETHPADRKVDKISLQDIVAKLYCQGIPRAKVARMMKDQLITDAAKQKPIEQQLTAARTTLRRWEHQARFRDKIYNQAVERVDLEAGQILAGITRKAKMGRVDAAKFALELTGRYTPKGDAPPANITIAFNGVPRPNRVTASLSEPAEIIDGEVEEETDE